MKKFKFIFLGIFLFIGIICFSKFDLYATVTYSPYNEYTIETDVDDPMTISEIADYLSLEAYQGSTSITSSIVNVDSGGYINNVLNMPTAASRTLGEYEVTFKAYATNGTTNTMSVTVDVCDYQAPVINTSFTKTNQTYSVQEIDSNINTLILRQVKACDNHDLSNVTYSVVDSNLTNVAGTYSVVVRSSDQSNNYLDTTITVTVVDVILPYFTADSSYILCGRDDNMNPVEAIDTCNVHGYSSSGTSLQITYDEPNNTSFTTVGIYEFVLTITEGVKENHFSIFIEVYDPSTPVFTLDETVLVTSANNLYSTESFNKAIRLKAGRSDFTYDVTLDEYTDNYDKAGDYKYNVLVTYEDSSTEEMCFVMRVIDNEEIEETTTVPFTEKFITITKKIGTILFGIVKWPIIKILSVF